jgi:geranylgeranyl diphosphate synthase, type II
LEFLKPYRVLIDRKLQSVPFPEYPVTLYDPQRYIISNGGKRVRPVLTLISCGLCGSEESKALPAALAVELIHNFTLIHDDIMDQADQRRGNPAVHVKWDQATAILAGDGMFVQAILQLQQISDDINHKKISGIFLKAINTVCEGQALDMEFGTRSDVSRNDYLEMIGGKTAALISAAMQMGGICAGANEEELMLLDEIGNSLGMAFQIQDDWLDITSEPEKFGKRKAGDIYEGKKTFLMLAALEKCTEKERAKLTGYLKNLPLNDGQVNEILEIYNRSGVIEEARDQMSTYYNKAENALQQFGESNYKRDLQHLIKYLKQREI